ncbi:SDR family NAD(P)-dependent oxidoreductase [bacterium RCC_150]
MTSYDFKGKAAFVTGAGAGMGAATARAFAEAVAAVAVVDLDGEAAERVAAELNAAGHRALAVQGDVSDETQVENAVARTVETFGGLDMAFNNAGIMLPPVDSADEAAGAFDKIVGVNLGGVWASMNHELFQMPKCCSAAESPYAQLLHDALLPEGIPLRAAIHPARCRQRGDPAYGPAALVETLWSIHTDSKEFRTFVGPLD